MEYKATVKKVKPIERKTSDILLKEFETIFWIEKDRSDKEVINEDYIYDESPL